MRDLSKVTKQKMAELEPLHPLPRFHAFHSSPASCHLPPVPCAGYQGSLQPSSMLWESLFLHPAWVFEEEVWRGRRVGGLGTHCGLPARLPTCFLNFFCLFKVGCHLWTPTVFARGGFILPPLPQQSLLASALGPLPGADGGDQQVLRKLRFWPREIMSSWGALARGCGTLYLRELGVHRQPELGISKGMGSGRLSKLEVQAEEEREETGRGL